ncbi:MAG TPA: DUF547 domain-containing protein [Thermoanaerobaculia bacterium]|nr:DUF547 domain-containing protein [Thermoanaerobaculia bacterium]
MRAILGRSLTAALAVLAAVGCGAGRQKETPRRVVVTAGIDHSEWSRLLAKYVDERGRVDYAGWKRTEADLAALRTYLARFAARPSPAATGHDLAASLINAYNAATIGWVLENFPIDSIRSTDDPFRERRHRVGGELVSLDDIEHGALRPLVGYRAHAALVCAARSCPPLRREAYEPARLDEQLDSAMRTWLAQSDLNRVEPVANRVEVSQIFRWFAADFDKAGGVRAVLQRYTTPEMARRLADPRLEIRYFRYDWGLNDRGGRSARYGWLRRSWDELRNRLR